MSWCNCIGISVGSEISYLCMTFGEYFSRRMTDLECLGCCEIWEKYWVATVISV